MIALALTNCYLDAMRLLQAIPKETMKKLFFTLLGYAALLLPAAVQAQSIASYDLLNVVSPRIIYGSPDYNGTITPTGKNSEFNYGCCGMFYPPLSNYTGGSGTLNNGADLDRDGLHAVISEKDHSAIVLHLSAASTIHTIDFFSPTSAGAGLMHFSGLLAGATISFGGQSLALDSTAWGPKCLVELCNDRFSLLGTSLDGLVTDTITINNFKIHPSPSQQLFNVGEITVNGAANGGLPAIPNIPAVPEPQTYAMLLSGLGVAGFMVRRRKRAEMAA